MSGLMDLILNAPSASDRFQQIQPFLSGGGIPGGTMPGGDRGPGPTGGTSDWEQQAKQFFLGREGYTRPEWRKVDSIIENESGWDPNAVNDSSGAAGIAQRISGYAPDYSRNDPMEQIRWLANYLGSHNYEGYGTGIDAAYAHKQATGWY